MSNLLALWQQQQDQLGGKADEWPTSPQRGSRSTSTNPIDAQIEPILKNLDKIRQEGDQAHYASAFKYYSEEPRIREKIGQSSMGHTGFVSSYHPDFAFASPEQQLQEAQRKGVLAGVEDTTKWKATAGKRNAEQQERLDREAAEATDPRTLFRQEADRNKARLDAISAENTRKAMEEIEFVAPVWDRETGEFIPVNTRIKRGEITDQMRQNPGAFELSTPEAQKDFSNFETDFALILSSFLAATKEAKLTVRGEKIPDQVFMDMSKWFSPDNQIDRMGNQAIASVIRNYHRVGTDTMRIERARERALFNKVAIMELKANSMKSVRDTGTATRAKMENGKPVLDEQGNPVMESYFYTRDFTPDEVHAMAEQAAMYLIRGDNNYGRPSPYAFPLMGLIGLNKKASKDPYVNVPRKLQNAISSGTISNPAQETDEQGQEVTTTKYGVLDTRDRDLNLAMKKFPPEVRKRIAVLQAAIAASER